MSYSRRWLRWLATVCTLALLLSGALVTAQAQDTDDGFVPNQVVIKLFNPLDLTAVASQYGLNPVPLSQFGTRPIYLMQTADAQAPPNKAEALQADPRVQYAEPNFLGQTPEGQQQSSWFKGGDSGGYANQWAPGTINLPAAHEVTRGAGMTVAVLDTGIAPAHPVFQGKLVSGYDFVNDDLDPREEGVEGQNIGYGHGTHVAGLVALAAPEAQIMPLRVLDQEGVGNVWVMAEAIKYAVENGADVINMSLSTRRETDLLEEVIEAAICEDDDDDDDDDDDRVSLRGDDDDDDDDDDDRDEIERGDRRGMIRNGDDDDDDDDCLDPTGRGVVVVAAAGNSGTTMPEYPAAEAQPGLLAIAASTEQDTLATFSTRGTWVDLAAPGDQILSSVPGGDYGTWSGTSMAAPLTAGTAALVRSTDPNLAAVDVANQIVLTAAPIQGDVPRRIDAAAALGYSPPFDHKLKLPVISR